MEWFLTAEVLPEPNTYLFGKRTKKNINHVYLFYNGKHFIKVNHENQYDYTFEPKKFQVWRPYSPGEP